MDRIGAGHPACRRILRRTSLLAATALVGALTLTVPAADAAPTARSGPVDEPGVTANLWEWNWPSIGKECSVLAKDGYTGAQVAPPQNSVKRTQLGNGSDTVLHPWWEVYQPVTYDLTSRMGTEGQFKAMVEKCREAGVKVGRDGPECCGGIDCRLLLSSRRRGEHCRGDRRHDQ